MENKYLYVFDMGGVVTTTSHDADRICEVLDIDIAEYRRCKKLSDGTDLFDLCTEGKISCKEFWIQFGKNLGREIETDYFHLFFHPEEIEGTNELIKKLKGEGNRVVCGTNTIESHYMNHIARGDYTVFDQTYASCFMNARKPDAKFWRLISEAENVSYDRMIFIDDREENIAAAKSLGIKAFCFESAEKLAKNLSEVK